MKCPKCGSHKLNMKGYCWLYSYESKCWDCHKHINRLVPIQLIRNAERQQRRDMIMQCIKCKHEMTSIVEGCNCCQQFECDDGLTEEERKKQLWL